MPQPKKRLSHTRSGNRRSHLKLQSVAVTSCSNCHTPVSPHTVCLNCGYYRGKRAIPQKAQSK
jgi:large subunit ribosomal protein L32